MCNHFNSSQTVAKISDIRPPVLYQVKLSRAPASLSFMPDPPNLSDEASTITLSPVCSRACLHMSFWENLFRTAICATFQA